MILVGAAFGHRSGGLTTATTLGLVAAGFVLALIGATTAVAGLRGIWRDGRSGFRRAASGLILAIMILAYPAALVWRVTALPALSDISTDLVDPPRFDDVNQSLPGPSQRTMQQAAYPDVATRHYAAGPAETFAAVMSLVDEREWGLVRSVAPAPPRRAGDDSLGPNDLVPDDAGDEAVSVAEPVVGFVTAIDGKVQAVARTGFIGFEEDVVVRIRSDGARTTVDMRSASRTFDHDFGSNAGRIEEFLNDLDAAIGG